MKSLHDVDWLRLGHTDDYQALKSDIAHTCRDVTRGGSINEICVHDILFVFKKHGYLVKLDPERKKVRLKPSMMLNVVACPHCKGSHPDLLAKPIPVPPKWFTHLTGCPVRGRTLLVSIRGKVVWVKDFEHWTVIGAVTKRL